MFELYGFSPNVAPVAAAAAIGIYDVPKVDMTTVAIDRRGVTAGSMRGDGTLQTMSALEVMIDEAALALKIDPIDFRRRQRTARDGYSLANLRGLTHAQRGATCLLRRERPC